MSTATTPSTGGSADVLDRRYAAPDAALPPPPRRADGGGSRGRPPGAGAATPGQGPLLTAAVAALVVCACLPLTRVFLDRGPLVPVLAAAAAALGVDWACRRLGLGPATTLALSACAWVAFVSLTFLADTLVAGLVPTSATWDAGGDLWVRGLELARLRPAPTYSEPGLVLLAVNGTWAVVHAVDGLVFRLGRPIAGIVMAMVLWTVPLALAPANGTAWLWAAPFLAASAAVLLASAGGELGRWGRLVAPGDPAGIARHRTTAPVTAVVLTGLAIAGGTLLADRLPGATAPPWYEVRGLGGTTLTSNPIVGMQQRLVAQDDGTVMQVRSPRPVYIRTTSLDVYGEREEWTNDGISGAPVRGGRVPDQVTGPVQDLALSLSVVDLPDAVLVPLPYQTVQVDGPRAGELQYDPRLATFTLDGGSSLLPGDVYDVDAVIPAPSAEQLAQIPLDPAVDPSQVALPSNVPPQVAEQARAIVDASGAVTPFDQALAIQNELRTWTYSLDVAPGHSGSAMAAFLESRTGYCEQFAGTMAVMLRSLGVPARVAVGFTPGTPVDAAAPAPGEPVAYDIALSNAHAWVEVLFPGHGWIAFEPTPRDDGNVLVPSAANLAPNVTAAGEQAAPAPVEEDPNDMPGLGNPGQLPAGAPTPAAVPGQAAGAAAGGSGGGTLVLVVIGLVVLGVAVSVARGRRRDPAERDPRDRVLAARAAVGRTGAGLGVAARPWETDEEYLRRLVDDRSGDPDAAAALARGVERVRWASATPSVEVAEDAEGAAGALRRSVLGRRGTVARGVVEARGGVAVAADAVQRLRRHRPSWPRRPAPDS